VETIFNAVGGRKMFFALAVLIATGVAFFVGKLSEGAWLDSIKWLLATYLTAAVGSDVAAAFTKPPEPPAPQP
jgi:hypothetical protein